MSARIPIAGPWVTEREVRYTADAAQGDWYGQAGRYTKRFEEAFAKYLGVKHAVSLPHCTAGLHLALLAMEVGPGDEVIVPDVTWIASVAPVCYVGATPVFADIDPVTWCLSTESVSQCITPRTKAIVPVDLYGSMSDYAALRSLATQHKFAILEDSAEAVGSEYHDRKAGALGDASAFSFHGSKTLTTGEGGLLATDSTDLFNRVMFLRDHGRPPGDRFFCNTEVAYKYKMSSLQAAFGLAQLERIDELIERKRRIFGWYHDRLADVKGVTLNAEPRGTRNSYWMITVVLEPGYNLTSRDLMKVFDAEQIDTRPFFHPLSSIPAFEKTEQAAAARARNTVSYRLSPRGINLPSALMLEESQVDRVCRVLVDTLKRAQG